MNTDLVRQALDTLAEHARFSESWTHTDSALYNAALAELEGTPGATPTPVVRLNLALIHDALLRTARVLAAGVRLPADLPDLIHSALSALQSALAEQATRLDLSEDRRFALLELAARVVPRDAGYGRVVTAYNALLECFAGTDVPVLPVGDGAEEPPAPEQGDD